MKLLALSNNLISTLKTYSNVKFGEILPQNVGLNLMAAAIFGYSTTRTSIIELSNKIYVYCIHCY